MAGMRKNRPVSRSPIASPTRPEIPPTRTAADGYPVCRVCGARPRPGVEQVERLGGGASGDETPPNDPVTTRTRSPASPRYSGIRSGLSQDIRRGETGPSNSGQHRSGPVRLASDLRRDRLVGRPHSACGQTIPFGPIGRSLPSESRLRRGAAAPAADPLRSSSMEEYAFHGRW